MDLWIARNKKGGLCLFYGKPEALPEHGCFVEGCFPISGVVDSMCLPKEWFPEVTWENSPKKVRLELVTEEPVTKKVGENIIPILGQKIADCGFSIRVRYCLKAAEIHTVGELVKYKRDDLLKFRNFGIRSLKEIEDFLSDHGLRFGMTNK